MTFCAGREDDSHSSRSASGWPEDGWRAPVVADEEGHWALVGNRRGKDDAAMRDMFAKQLTDVSRVSVESLSWDLPGHESSGDDDDDDDDGSSAFVLPAASVSPTAEADPLHWDLISPCSETSSSRSRVSSPLTHVLRSSRGSELKGSEHESEGTHAMMKASAQELVAEEELEELEEHEQERGYDVQVEEEEGATADDSTTCWVPDVCSVLSSAAVTPAPVNPFAGHPSAALAETRDQSTHEVRSTCDEATRLRRPSLLPRVPIAAPWRRPKARTCSGAGSAAMALAAVKARARSVSRAGRHPVTVKDDEDDGDFSSDDEGYRPALPRRSVDEMEPSQADQRRRAASTGFARRRLSVNVSMKPAMVAKHLQDAVDKLNSQLHLLRSGSSASTAMSEESYLESPAYQEVMASPTRASSIRLDAATPVRLISAANACSAESDPQQSTRQQKLRAGVFKAAGLLNVVSAEAARKLKSRGFRGRQKAASETEEEDSEFSSPYSGTLDI